MEHTSKNALNIQQGLKAVILDSRFPTPPPSLLQSPGREKAFQILELRDPEGIHPFLTLMSEL